MNIWNIIQQKIVGNIDDMKKMVQRSPEEFLGHFVVPNTSIEVHHLLQSSDEAFPTEVHDFLRSNYTNSDRCLEYSMPLLCCYVDMGETYLIIARNNLHQIVGCITTSKRRCIVQEESKWKDIECWYMNFLCVSQSMRKTGMASYLMLLAWKTLQESKRQPVGILQTAYCVPCAVSTTSHFIYPLHLDGLLEKGEIELPAEPNARALYIDKLRAHYSYPPGLIIDINVQPASEMDAASICTFLEAFKKRTLSMYWKSTPQQLQTTARCADFQCLKCIRSEYLVAYFDYYILDETKAGVASCRIAKLYNYAFDADLEQNELYSCVFAVVDHAKKVGCDVIEFPEALVLHNPYLLSRSVKESTYNVHVINHSFIPCLPAKNGLQGF